MSGPQTVLPELVVAFPQGDRISPGIHGQGMEMNSSLNPFDQFRFPPPGLMNRLVVRTADHSPVVPWIAPCDLEGQEPQEERENTTSDSGASGRGKLQSAHIQFPCPIISTGISQMGLPETRREPQCSLSQLQDRKWFVN